MSADYVRDSLANIMARLINLEARVANLESKTSTTPPAPTAKVATG